MFCPTPLPFVGNLWTLARYPPGEDCHLKWEKEYGPIFTYWVGEMPIVCITDYEKIIDTFQKDADTFAGRTTFPEMDNILKGGTHGVFNTEAELWRDQRKLALHALADFGLGQNMMQERVLTEVSALIDNINTDLDAGVIEHNIAEQLEIGAGSTINEILFGYRFSGEKAGQYFELKKLAVRYFELLGTHRVQLLLAKPHVLKHFPVFRQAFKDMKQVAKAFFGFFEERIKEHELQLKREEKQKRDASGEPHFYSNTQLENMCFDLWLDGQLTTGSTMAWAVAYLINNQVAQKKLHQELDAETLRTANVVPENALHRTTKDVEIDGHLIQKGTCCLPQISAVLHNPKIYNNPKQFNPERFLDENGLLKKCDELIPFSVGKRKCLGEPLAKMEIFLFLANIFNRYEFSAGTISPSLDRTNGGVIITCPPFICLIKSEYKCI
uniref:Unspecific monooxygenase n=1 Tax=Ditylenchus dipsaci TaxID=166011 RepID=A0A915DRQ3_9BILA